MHHTHHSEILVVRVSHRRVRSTNPTPHFPALLLFSLRHAVIPPWLALFGGVEQAAAEATLRGFFFSIICA